MVLELMGADGDARLSLWSLLCSIDLFPNVEAENQPPDLELVWQVANPRLIRRRPIDGMYVRLLDIPAALEARRAGTYERLYVGLTLHEVSPEKGEWSWPISIDPKRSGMENPNVSWISRPASRWRRMRQVSK